MQVVRNRWYMAAWSTAIAPGARVARTVIGVPMLVHHTADGRLLASDDRCPHRVAPMSRGTNVRSVPTC